MKRLLCLTALFLFFGACLAFSQVIGTLPAKPFKSGLGVLAVEPSVVPVSVETEVKYSLELNGGVQAPKIPIFVAQIDQKGILRGPIIRLYDDGTHGDLKANDRIYANVISIKEDKAKKQWVIATTGIVKDIYLSNFVPFDIIKPLGAQEKQSISTLVEDVSAKAGDWLSSLPISEAQNSILNYLKNNPQIKSATLSDDRYTITIILKNGALLLLSTAPPGTLSRPGGNVSLVAAPLYSDLNEGIRWGAQQETDRIRKMLSGGTKYTPEVTKDSDLTIEKLKTLYLYSVISFFTHGGTYTKPYFWQGSGVWLQSGQRYMLTDGQELTDLLAAKRISIHINPSDHYYYYSITDDFISSLSGKFSKSLVFMSACQSCRNDAMANAFINKGAATYLGWNNDVSVLGAYEKKVAMFSYMINHQKSVGEAYNSINHNDPYPRSNPPAELIIKGDLNLLIFSKRSFSIETYDLVTFYYPGAANNQGGVGDQVITNTGEVTLNFKGQYNGTNNACLISKSSTGSAPIYNLTTYWNPTNITLAPGESYQQTGTSFIAQFTFNSNITPSSEGTCYLYYALGMGPDDDTSQLPGVAIPMRLKFSQDINILPSHRTVYYSSIGGAASGALPKLNGATQPTGQQESVPLVLTIYSNYPNPFNSMTTISFSLTRETKVKLEIFNSIGQRIRLLENDLLPAGMHAVQWDGKDVGGAPAPSGVYFYRLSTDNFYETKKMILMQ